MKHVMMIFCMWYTILVIGILDTRTIWAREPRFEPERYQKVMISEKILYLTDRQKRAPGRYMAHLAAVSLTEEREPHRFPLYIGVYIELETILKDGEESVSSAASYPMRWDIETRHVLFIHIDDVTKVPFPGIELFEVAVDELPTLTPEKMEDRSLPSLFPLDRLLWDDHMHDRARKISFDIMAIGERIFDLYIACEGTLTVWRFDETIETPIKTGWREIVDDREHEVEITGWEQRHSWPIDFEGPFHIIRLRENTYLFSEQTGMISLLEEQNLRPIAQIPHTRNQKPGEQYLIVDKDYGQLHIVVSPLTQSENLTLLTIGDTRSIRQGLESAFRSAVELSERSAQ